MQDQAKPGYREFYDARGRQAMWLTGSVAYRIGALLAVPADRLGLSPNVVSLASLATAVVGSVAAVWVGYESWLAALIFLVMGHLAYGLDCADGVLARVTGRGSAFGAVLDKAMDSLVVVAMPIILAFGALGDLAEGAWWKFGTLAIFLATRNALVVAMWLRESIERRERTAEDQRARTLGFLIKQAVGNVVLDDVAFRTFLALAWGLGLFWEFVLIQAALVPMIFLTYLLSMKRAMEAEGRQ